MSLSYPEMSIRVAIVEDDAKVRESLEDLINRAEHFCCTGSFPNAEMALKKIPREWPDLALMDINLPKMSGIQCVAVLKTQRPELQILMLTAYEDNELIFDSLKAGANGYLVKRTSPAEILAALKDVHDGGAPMSSSIARKVVQHFRRTPEPKSDAIRLTPREKDILDQLAQGFRYKEITENLGISNGTLNSYIRNIYEKLHVHSRTEAVEKYLGNPQAGK
ncbi:MAG: response regulator transcription factor [Verrucomicrobiota bacterium]